MKRSDSPTLREVAKVAGVSHVTVSLALRNDPRLPAPTRARIRKIAAKMGYRRKAMLSMAMAHMRLRFPQRLIANLALINATEDFVMREFPFTLRIAGAVERARELGFGMEIIQAPAVRARQPLVRQLQARGVKGVIMIGSILASWRSDLNALLDYFPMVCLGTAFADWPRFPESCTNPFALGYGLARRMSQGRFSSIGYCLEEFQGAEEFEHGFNAGCHSVGAKMPRLSRKVRRADRTTPSSTLRWYFQNRPDAIVTTTTAMEGWLEQGGVRIPEDVSLFHWNPPEGWSGWDNRNHEMGAAAVDLAMGQIYRGEKGISAHAVQVTLTGSFVQGRTSRPIDFDPGNWPGSHPSALRAAKPSWFPLDFSSRFNSDYVREWPLPLLHFPPGPKTIHGIPFMVGDGRHPNAHRCLHLDPAILSGPAALLKVTIPVKRRVVSVYFLHSSARRGLELTKKPPPPVFPEYHFQFSSGAEERQSLVMPVKNAARAGSSLVGDWWPHPRSPRDFSPRAHQVAIVSENDLENYKRYLYTLEWNNPHPNDPLNSIRIVLAAKAITQLTVFGITLLLG